MEVTYKRAKRVVTVEAPRPGERVHRVDPLDLLTTQKVTLTASLAERLKGWALERGKGS